MGQGTAYPDDSVTDILADMERAGLEPKEAAQFAARLIAIGAEVAISRPDAIDAVAERWRERMVRQAKASGYVPPQERAPHLPTDATARRMQREGASRLAPSTGEYDGTQAQGGGPP